MVTINDLDDNDEWLDDGSYVPSDDDSDDDSNDEGSYVSDDEDDDNNDDHHDPGFEVGEVMHSNADANDIDEDVEEEMMDEIEDEQLPGVNAAKDGDNPDDDAPGSDVDDEEIVDNEEIPGVNAAEDGFTHQEQTDLEREMDTKYGVRTGKYNLRQRKKPQYNFAVSGVIEENLATPQMSMNQGIKMFGEAGVQAVKKELEQVHERKVMRPCKHRELTSEQKREALAYLMFLKRKRCGTVKGRGCADGRKQRSYIAKEDASSPAVATESVFLMALIDAEERPEVAVVDIPGAFMQADMDEETFVRIHGKMAELLLEIDPEMYKPCVIYEGKEKVIYVKLLKALYGTLRAARLFWEKLSRQLMDWGFEINPYD
jgi:hypothetical protein